MQDSFHDSRNAWLRLRRVASLLLMLSGLLTLFTLCSAVGAATSAADGLTPVRLRIGGRDVVNKIASVSNGSETYVSLETLSAVGATGKVDAKGETAQVLLASKKQGELALVHLNGAPMLALSDLARLLNATIASPPEPPDGEKPLTEAERKDKQRPTPDIQHPRSVFLLAHVTDVRFEEGALRVTTSFPVPYQARNVRGEPPPRGYIDCIGATVDDGFQPTALPAGEQRAVKLRTGQNSLEVARVVVELADGLALKAIDAPVNSALQIGAGLDTNAKNAAEQTPVATAVKSVSKTAPGASGTPGAPGRGTSASRGVRRDPFPIEVHSMAFRAETISRGVVEIATSGKASPSIHYQPGVNRLVIELTNALPKLPEEAPTDQTLTHPLVSGLHMELIQEKPPITRITVDTERTVGFSMNVQENTLSLELRVPRSAGGKLADKLIVIDAGHGGSSSGATGRHGNSIVYEKNITLAIAWKLRDILEGCGANVVMTRDRDVDVDLYARPRLANEIGADLFISIHNDSTSQAAGTASGTSTYYHMGDPSSRTLAICVQQAVSSVTGLPSRGALSDGILYQNGLAVLRVSTMPAVLCEVAYINNASDRRKLIDEEFQQRVAQAMCDGIRNYVEGNPHPSRRMPPALPVAAPMQKPGDVMPAPSIGSTM